MIIKGMAANQNGVVAYYSSKIKCMQICSNFMLHILEINDRN